MLCGRPMFVKDSVSGLATRLQWVNTVQYSIERCRLVVVGDNGVAGRAACRDGWSGKGTRSPVCRSLTRKSFERPCWYEFWCASSLCALRRCDDVRRGWQKRVEELWQGGRCWNDVKAKSRLVMTLRYRLNAHARYHDLASFVAARPHAAASFNNNVAPKSALAFCLLLNTVSLTLYSRNSICDANCLSSAISLLPAVDS